MRNSSLIRRVILLVIMAIPAAAFFSGCAKMGGPPAGELELYVINNGVDPVEDISISHNGDVFDVPYLEPGQSAESKMLFDTGDAVRVSYIGGGERNEEAFRLRALDRQGGVIEFHFDREGSVKPVERFYMHE